MDMTNQEGSHSAQYVVSSWFGVGLANLMNREILIKRLSLEDIIIILVSLQEEFEDAKGLIRIRISKKSI
jgi:hypothetical protein